MFEPKISVQDLLIELYGKANDLILSIKNTKKEEMLAEADIAFFRVSPVNDDFLYGEIQGIEFVLDLLTDLISDKAISNDVKVFIEIFEENIKEARIVLHARNSGKILGH